MTEPIPIPVPRPSLSREDLAESLMNASRKSALLPPIALSGEPRSVRSQWIAVADAALKLAPEVRT